MRSNLTGCILALSFLTFGTYSASAEDTYRSHPPARPLPVASDRPLADGSTYFVDAERGDDARDGSRDKPWRTLQHAAGKLQPGDTLVLRGGIYREHATIACSGEPGRPITIRSHPGELAILDGSLPDFFDNPATAWEPCPGGVPGEYWSAKTYPGLGDSPDGVNVLGFFADSMNPLQGYRLHVDLRDPSMEWDVESKVSGSEGVYCGPGIFYDIQTGRLHCRLAHTTIHALGTDNYRGETDPRTLPLLIAGAKAGPVLSVHNAHDVRFCDLVVRGSAAATVDVQNCQRVTFDGLTVYSGFTAFQVEGTAGLRLWNTACRGIAAPWTFRGYLKYRSTEARIISTGGWVPSGAGNRDFEFAWSEFTDSVDGVFVGNVRGLRFHHNLVDNISDDGFHLTAATGYDGVTPGGDVEIYQNLLARCLTTFAFGVGKGRQRAIAGGVQTGAGVKIYRNVFDFRRPVMYQYPADLAKSESLPAFGRFASDHGSPIWEPMTIYHNTILAEDQVGYGTAGLGDHVGGGAPRRVFNNIVVQMSGLPGQALPEIVLAEKPAEPGKGKKQDDALDGLLDDSPDRPEKDEPAGKKKAFSSEVDPDKLAEIEKSAANRPVPPATNFQADGNLFWSLTKGSSFDGEFLGAFRASPAFQSSKEIYSPGWTAHDQFADPRLALLTADWRTASDVTLAPDSPAIDAGVELSADWPDPLRTADRGHPDIGALPLETKAWRVGVRGRLSASGKELPPTKLEKDIPRKFDAPMEDEDASAWTKPAAIVAGYPPVDVPLVDFSLQKTGAKVRTLERTWLPAAEYGDHACVALVGDLKRAQLSPDAYSEEELPLVENYLQQGGTLLLFTRGKRVFDATHHGQKFLQKLAGIHRPSEKSTTLEMPKHAWIGHLDQVASHAWLAGPADNDNPPLLPEHGEIIIRSPRGDALLYRLPVGRGQLIYVGWSIESSLPGREGRVTLADEEQFADQMKILNQIAKSCRDR